ncbi:hypothetical protein I5535_04165 [Rhodobacteraceae bacterium F11138]|nr:hypothetical protein [Rhodobacteraceae bacterium F11138]
MTTPMQSFSTFLGAPLLAIALSAPLCAGEADTRLVQVLGRTWTVSENPKQPDSYVAFRDNNNLNPFGKPVARRTPQAVRALELATGCKVIPGTLWQTVGAEFHAKMRCNG